VNKTNLLRGFFWLGLIICLAGLVSILAPQEASLPASCWWQAAGAGRPGFCLAWVAHLAGDGSRPIELEIGDLAGATRSIPHYFLAFPGWLSDRMLLSAGLQPTLEYLYGLAIAYLPPWPGGSPY